MRGIRQGSPLTFIPRRADKSGKAGLAPKEKTPSRVSFLLALPVTLDAASPSDSNRKPAKRLRFEKEERRSE